MKILEYTERGQWVGLVLNDSKLWKYIEIIKINDNLNLEL